MVLELSQKIGIQKPYKGYRLLFLTKKKRIDGMPWLEMIHLKTN
jgi:hypothetical protein